MKSEPDVFSIDDLAKKPNQISAWDGVRNYQARNFMMNDMKVGDEVLFYHSNATPPGIAGLANVASASYPDPTQFDKKSEYYDAKATKEKPRWFLVDVKFKAKFKTFIPLDQIKVVPELSSMIIVQKGTRLSITPVTKKEYEVVVKLGRA
jgi:predicted RNA-binding protein with PUA-like domain